MQLDMRDNNKKNIGSGETNHISFINPINQTR